jgi:ABC-type sugar transport system ATPase subunit
MYKLQLNNIVKTFGEHTICDGININVLSSGELDLSDWRFRGG